MTTRQLQPEGVQGEPNDPQRPTGPTDGGRRDRKKNATRQALRNAAIELVAERGFAHVTIEDITEAADVATRTFFNYFPSKESAVVGSEPEHIEQLLQRLLERPQDESPLEALRAVTLQYTSDIDKEFEDLGEGREIWIHRFSVVRNDPDLVGAYVAHTSEFERALVSALAQRLGTDPSEDPYPALVAAAVMSAVRVAAQFWGANGGTGSLCEIADAAINCLAGGLVDDKTLLEASFEHTHRNHQTTPSSSDGLTKVDKNS